MKEEASSNNFFGKSNFRYYLKWLWVNVELIKRWNWRAITICFITAATFWVFNSLNADHTASIRLPIEIVYPGENIIPLQTPPENVNINVSGYGWNLLSKSMGFNMEPLYLEIEDPIRTDYISPKVLLSSVTDRLKELKVNFIVEDSLHFNFDTLITKVIWLEVDTTSMGFQSGFKRVGEFLLDPDSVVLRGAATLIRDYVDTLKLRPRIEDIDEDIDEELDLPLKGNRFVSINPQEVQLQFPVEEFFRKSIILKPVMANFPQDSSVFLGNQALFLDYTIKESDLIGQPDSLEAIIDYNRVNWQDSTIAPVVNSPAFFLDTLLIPSKLKLSFTE